MSNSVDRNSTILRQHSNMHASFAINDVPNVDTGWDIQLVLYDSNDKLAYSNNVESANWCWLAHFIIDWHAISYGNGANQENKLSANNYSDKWSITSKSFEYQPLSNQW